MKTFTKFIPVALALMLSVPAFAETSPTATSTMQINVPEFINITKESAQEASTASFNDTYTTITLSPAMNANFRVITNKPGDQVKLTGTALGGSTQVNALFGTVDALNLVFTNTTSTEPPADTAVSNITGGTPAAKDNANAIAFTLTPTITPNTASGATTPGKAFATGIATYTLNTSGVYDMSYAVGTTAVANTFSTHDTNGTYKATITLSQVTP